MYSDELIGLSCSFFLYGGPAGEMDALYNITVQKESDGRYVLCEKGLGISCEPDGEYLLDVHNILIKYNLFKLNGINRYTEGLAPQFAPCCLEARYSSGKRLYFCINNNPESDWAREFLKLTRKEFKKHNITSLNSPLEFMKVVRFMLNFADNENCHMLSEINVPKPGVNKSLEQLATEGYAEDETEPKIIHQIRNRSDNQNIRHLAEKSDDYYAGLSELIANSDIADYATSIGVPRGYNYREAPCYYKFIIEFEGGQRMQGFSDDPVQCNNFIPIAKIFSDYIENYINQPSPTGEK